MTEHPDDDWGGMDTGSERGAPGEHLPEPPLTEDEQRLLEELQRPVEGQAVTAVEDSPAAVEAVEDDSPLPVGGGAPADGGEPDEGGEPADGGEPGDPDTARFRAPGDPA
jgi:hypothetical protein